jgi:hemoglobin-like flavoprotein
LIDQKEVFDMAVPTVQGQSAKRGAADSGQYFRYMAEYVGFTAEDARIIRQTKPVIVKHMSRIIGEFYEKVLRYPPTRKHFLKRDGTVDQEYLELRMRHQANFWLRTTEGVFDDDYASYVDYVGRAHTSRGADPHIYIAERYVIGQVGFLQHAISEAINQEYAGEDFAFIATEAWDKLMMVLLELLARAYEHEREAESFDSLIEVDGPSMARLAEHAFDHELRVAHRAGPKEFLASKVSEIPNGNGSSSILTGSRSGYSTTKASGTRCATAACTAAAR